VKYEELLASLKDDECVVVYKKDGFAAVYPAELEVGEMPHLRRLFKIKDGQFEEINLNAIVKEIVDFLEHKITPKKLLEDVLKTSDPNTIMEVLERIRKKPKVKEAEGCYYLLIGGKRGLPLQLNIR